MTDDLFLGALQRSRSDILRQLEAAQKDREACEVHPDSCYPMSGQRLEALYELNKAYRREAVLRARLNHLDELIELAMTPPTKEEPCRKR